MTLIRKLIIVLVGLSLAVLVTVLLLDPQSVMRLAINMSETSALIRLPLAILVDILVLAVIVILVRGQQSHTSSGLIVKAQGAIADVSVESTRDRILRAVRTVPNVVTAEGEVKAVRGKADVDLEVTVSHDSTSLPEKQREIDRALRQVINKELGLQMAGKPRVHIRMEGESSISTPVPPVVTPLPLPSAPTETRTIIEPELPGEAPLRVETIQAANTMALRSTEDKPEPPAGNASG